MKLKWIALGLAAVGIAIWWFKGRQEPVSLEGDMIPDVTYPSSRYPLFISKPALSPIWQDLHPYDIKRDYPFPSTTEKLNLPSYVGHLARVANLD